MSIANYSLYILSFIAIWFGAGLIIRSVDRIARRLHLSSFAISFFILGLLTSIPETAVSFSAVIEHKPEIFVGTFLGGVVVIFLFIIPVLAILGKGIKLNHDLDDANLVLALMVIATPAFLVIDHMVTNIEGALLIFLYCVLLYFIQKKHGIFEKQKPYVLFLKKYSFFDLVQIGVGIAIVFVSSQNIVSQTIEFASIFHVSAYYISIIALSLGTNLPELSIAVRAIMSGKKDIAFGDYLGSAAANTFLFGFFTIINNGDVLTVNNFLITFLFIAFGLGMFYYCAQSKRDISIKEGFLLFGIYVIFVIYELRKGTLPL